MNISTGISQKKCSENTTNLDEIVGAVPNLIFSSMIEVTNTMVAYNTEPNFFTTVLMCDEEGAFSKAATGKDSTALITASPINKNIITNTVFHPTAKEQPFSELNIKEPDSVTFELASNSASLFNHEVTTIENATESGTLFNIKDMRTKGKLYLNIV